MKDLGVRQIQWYVQKLAELQNIEPNILRKRSESA